MIRRRMAGYVCAPLALRKKKKKERKERER
jgi:hypothetical protein